MAELQLEMQRQRAARRDLLGPRLELVLTLSEVAVLMSSAPAREGGGEDGVPEDTFRRFLAALARVAHPIFLKVALRFEEPVE